MKAWLKEKETEQKNLFDNFLNETVATISTLNKELATDLNFRVVFSKDNWLNGKAEVIFVNKEEKVLSYYNHSIYNEFKSIPKQVTKLMEKGILTNTWFSILDESRTFDTDFLINDKGFTLENEDCEYLEKRFKEKSYGFNIEAKEKKPKLN